ncbi:unnamed protein product [Umbelopsis vinacea]
MTNTRRRRRARQTAISEDAVIPLPQLRSEAVLGKRNSKRERIDTDDAESNLRLAFAKRLNSRIEAELRSMLKVDVDIHGEIADDRLNTLRNELSNTSRAPRGISEQADIIHIILMP